MVVQPNIHKFCEITVALNFDNQSQLQSLSSDNIHSDSSGCTERQPENSMAAMLAVTGYQEHKDK